MVAALVVGALLAVALGLRRVLTGRWGWIRRLRDARRRRVNRRGGTLLRELRVENADEVVLADRVRSSIGPLIHELDLPRIHVMAEGDRVLLHGDVDTPETRERIEAAVRRVEGVETVASYLRVGLLPGEHRPSESPRDDPSAMTRRMHEALARLGIDGRPAELALGETVRLWTAVLPADERAHVMAHLPDDVRAFVGLQPPGGAELPDCPADLFEEVRRRSGLRAADTEHAVRAIIHELHTLVPEERDDIAAVLPPGLLALWA